eukprot:jgi/Bigna1/129357/aug1.8_g4065
MTAAETYAGNYNRVSKSNKDVMLEMPLKTIERSGLSFFEAFQSTVKAIIGTGVLALPHAFQLSGSLFGPILVVSIAMYTMCMNLTLTACYEMRPAQPTYSGQWIGSLNLIIMQIFVCAAHFTFMGKNFTSALNSWGLADIDFRLSLILCGTLVSGFTLLNDISFLKNTSLLGNIAVLVSLISIMIYASPSLNTNNVQIGTSVPELAVFFSICIYMFNSIGEVLPISTSMQKREDYPRVLAASFGVLVVAYLVFGLVVAWSFGKNTRGLVFENLEGPVVGVVKVFHGIAVFCTVPLKYFSAINDGLLPLMDKCCGIVVRNECGPLKVSMRLALVVISLVITLTVPDFAFLVALVGGFSITIVAFILPPLMYL